MTSHKDAKPANTVVTSNTGWGSWTRTRKLHLLAGGLVIVALLIVLGVLGRAALLHKPSKPKAPTQVQDLNPLTPENTLKKAEASVGQATSTNDKINAYLALGAAYADNNQLPQAINAYQQANTLSNSQSLAALIQLGYLYNRTEQRQQLVATLQQTIALMQQDQYKDPRFMSELPWYQSALQRVEAGGSL